MAIHNLGSINIDLVYRVPHIPAPGETLASTSFSRGLGGKGANMAIAVAASGAKTYFYGAVGADGDWTLDELKGRGVNCAAVAQSTVATGHAIIQVDDKGENAITLFAGANRNIPLSVLDELNSAVTAGDWLLLQNEADHPLEAAKLAQANVLKVAYAAAPFEVDAALAMIGHIDLLALNEIEATQMEQSLGHSVFELDVDMVLVTRGSAGATLRQKAGGILKQPATKATNVVDTTGAGDTYLGYFLGCLDNGDAPQAAMHKASVAAGIAVGRLGAAAAIPTSAEVNAQIEN